MTWTHFVQRTHFMQKGYENSETCVINLHQIIYQTVIPTATSSKVNQFFSSTAEFHADRTKGFENSESRTIKLHLMNYHVVIPTNKLTYHIRNIPTSNFILIASRSQLGVVAHSCNPATGKISLMSQNKTFITRGYQHMWTHLEQFTRHTRQSFNRLLFSIPIYYLNHYNPNL